MAVSVELSKALDKAYENLSHLAAAFNIKTVRSVLRSPDDLAEVAS
jgi:hypothetical protein